MGLKTKRPHRLREMMDRKGWGGGHIFKPVKASKKDSWSEVERHGVAYPSIMP